MASAATSVGSHQIRRELRQAVFDCRERGLHEAASWAAQQLNALPAGESDEPCTASAALAGDETDVFLMAKCMFDCKVRLQCAWACA